MTPDAPPNFKPRVGTHLKLLLLHWPLKVHVSSGCKCLERAKFLDTMTPEWCEQNIDTVVAWLREESLKRGIPFLNTVGRMLVRRAIANARKEAKV